MTIADSTGVGIGIAVFFILWVVIGIGSLVMLIVALIDIVKRPEWQWKLAGQEKVLWLLLVILVNFHAIPSLIYWFNIGRKLKVVEVAAANGHYGPGHMTFGARSRSAPQSSAGACRLVSGRQRPGSPPVVGQNPMDGSYLGGKSPLRVAEPGSGSLVGRRCRLAGVIARAGEW
jgi:hypothetical protein